MATSPGILIVLIGFAIYLGFRLESLDEIWSELDDYQTLVEGEYLRFLSREYVEPFLDLVNPDIDTKSMDEDDSVDWEFLSELIEENDRLENEGVSRDERREIMRQIIKEELQMTDFTTIMLNSVDFDDPMEALIDKFVQYVEFFPTKAQREKLPDDVFAKMSDSKDNMGGDVDIIDTQGELFSYFVYKEELLDPGGVFSEAKTFYRRYVWPNRIYALIQATILTLILSIGLLILLNIIGNSVPENLPVLIGLGIVMWVLLELGLWYILSTEIEMSSRTGVGKFLKPDPREIF